MANRHVASMKEMEFRIESQKKSLWAEAKRQIDQALSEGQRRGVNISEERYTIPPNLKW